jgi:molecular chaperone GrpE
MFKSKKQEEVNKEAEVKGAQQEAGAQENVNAETNAAEQDGNQVEADANGEGQQENGEQGQQPQPTAEEQLTAKLAETNDKYIRLAAEFDNYRRRVAKEKLDLISTAGEDVIKGLLPVLDDCERALQVLNASTDSEAAKAAKEGTELIYNKLMGYLKSKGLAPIEAVGKELDTDFHEAVAQFPVQEAEKKNKIFDVTQQGYTLNGKVIRFAKVVVGI